MRTFDHRVVIVVITVCLTSQCQGDSDDWNGNEGSRVQMARQIHDTKEGYRQSDRIHRVHYLEVWDDRSKDQFANDDGEASHYAIHGDDNVDNRNKMQHGEEVDRNNNRIGSEGGDKLYQLNKRVNYEGSTFYTGRKTSIVRHCVINKRVARCANVGLKEIPRNLPKSITSLFLSHNYIEHLPDGALSRYSKLIHLDLSNNRIQNLSNGSFDGLVDLENLTMSCNRLLYRKENFPDHVFAPLKKLIQLNISYNTLDINKNMNYSYPDTALSRLKNLQVLQIDGLYKAVFGIGFKEMTSLRQLFITGYQGGYCNIGHLYENTFIYLTGLTTLYLESCFILGKYLDKRAFLPLTQLRDLSLKHNEDIGVSSLHSLFYGLQNATKLERLNLHLIVNRYSLGICLDNKLIQRIPKSIKYLNVQENNLAAVNRLVIEALPPGLQELDISGNHFVFGTYLKDVHKMKSLQRIKINGGSFQYRIPTVYPYDQPRDHSLTIRDETTATTPIHPTVCSLYDCTLDEYPDSKFILKFPPNLKTIEMEKADLSYTLSTWDVDPDNVVENVFIGNNIFKELLGPIVGFNKLLQLDIRESFVEYISDEFFNNLTSLKTLELQANWLGRHFERYPHSRCFIRLLNLLHLNLSFNSIRFLNRDVFKGMGSLEYLYIDENPGLNTFLVDLSHMKQLKYIGLKKSQISLLPMYTRTHIDSLIQSGVSTQVDLSGAPILCVCNNLDFLKWMAGSKAFDKSFPGYECNYKDFTRKILQNGYDHTIRLLSKECTNNIILIISVTAVFTIFIFALITLTCYRHRWKVKYLYYSAQLYFTKNTTRIANEFEFDVFLSYANEDSDLIMDVIEPELCQRNIKVLVHARDFMAGRFIGSNILDAICKSRKTLVLFTRFVLKSKWCQYEIQMATEESVKTGRHVLMFLLKDRPDNGMGDLDIVHKIKSNTYLEFPDKSADEVARKIFWDKLASDIRS